MLIAVVFEHYLRMVILVRVPYYLSCCAELYFIIYKLGPTGIWTQVVRFKVWSANHYTIGPNIGLLTFSPLIACRSSGRSAYAVFVLKIVLLT